MLQCSVPCPASFCRGKVLLEGLDETSGATRASLLNVVVKEFTQLPEWIDLVVTGRPEAVLITLFFTHDACHRWL